MLGNTTDDTTFIDLDNTPNDIGIAIVGYKVESLDKVAGQIADSSGDGVWQYRVGGGEWTTLGDLENREDGEEEFSDAPIHLDKDAEIRFKTDDQNGCKAELYYYYWDNAGDPNNAPDPNLNLDETDSEDKTVNRGEETHYSEEHATLVCNVESVDDAPSDVLYKSVDNMSRVSGTEAFRDNGILSFMPLMWTTSITPPMVAEERLKDANADPAVEAPDNAEKVTLYLIGQEPADVPAGAPKYDELDNSQFELVNEGTDNDPQWVLKPIDMNLDPGEYSIVIVAYDSSDPDANFYQNEEGKNAISFTITIVAKGSDDPGEEGVRPGPSIPRP